MSDIIVIAHNLRSTHNVGSLLRTAEGLGVKAVILSGYTPYPLQTTEDRLPHLANKIDRQITKTALGAEKTQVWTHSDDILVTIAKLHAEDYCLAAIEQADHSTPLPGYLAPSKLALLVGREVEGIEPEILALCDDILEIPMFGQKESFNVVQAAAMALYQVTFH
jgi:tRNA G18 (ribose-2'-O)-methylase SpoU